MRETAALASLLTAILIGSPAAPAVAWSVAQTPAPQQAPAPVDAPEDEAEGDENPAYWEEVLCRAGPRGASRLSRQRVCKTRAAWREHDDNARDTPTRERSEPREPGP